MDKLTLNAELKKIENAMWLCRNCHNKADKTEIDNYPQELLRDLRKKGITKTKNNRDTNPEMVQIKQKRVSNLFDKLYDFVTDCEMSENIAANDIKKLNDLIEKFVSEAARIDFDVVNHLCILLESSIFNKYITRLTYGSIILICDNISRKDFFWENKKIQELLMRLTVICYNNCGDRILNKKPEKELVRNLEYFMYIIQMGSTETIENIGSLPNEMIINFGIDNIHIKKCINFYSELGTATILEWLDYHETDKIAEKNGLSKKNSAIYVVPLRSSRHRYRKKSDKDKNEEDLRLSVQKTSAEFKKLYCDRQELFAKKIFKEVDVFGNEITIKKV